MPSMDTMANGGVESSAESPAPALAAEAEDKEAVAKSSPAAATKGRGLRRWRRIRREQQREDHGTPAQAEDKEAVAKSSPAAATKGRGLRRWRRIRREQQREDRAAAVGGGGMVGGGDEESAQLHKRRLPVPADAPKGKHEAAPVEPESSTASVESRFVPAPPVKLEPGLGLLIAPAGFVVGADFGTSEDRGSRSSTAASAPRAFPRHGHDATDRPRSRAPASLHGRNPRGPACSRADRLRVYAAAAAAASTEAENSRSSVESDLRGSNALKSRHLGVGVTGNGVHKGMSDSCDHSDEEQPSEEVRSTAAGGYYRQNGSSVVGGSADSDDDVEDTMDEASVQKGQDGGLHSGADPYSESILLLLRTQEALENEIGKIAEVGREPSDNFDVHDGEGSGSVHLEEPIEELSERIKHLESSLEEASVLIKEKDSKIQLRVLGRMQSGKTEIEITNLLLLQSELDGLYQKKTEAEIQCIILTRAYQTWSTLPDDQMALYEAQKSLSEDYKQLGLKLRHTEKRAVMLEETAEKLQVQCKELSRSSEVLQLQSKASRVSLFCFVHFILLCIAIGTYLMRLVPSSTEVVPT